MAGLRRRTDRAALVYLDHHADVVFLLDAPLSENTNRRPRPSLDATGTALATLMADKRVAALTVTEFNPHHGSDATTGRLADVLVSALLRGA